MLNETEWHALEKLEIVLQPLAEAQRFLEGDKYVTIPACVIAVRSIRENFKHIIVQADDIPENVYNLTEKMERKLEESFGDPYSFVFNEKPSRGHRQRQVGLHPIVIMGTILCPKFKSTLKAEVIKNSERKKYGMPLNGIWYLLNFPEFKKIDKKTISTFLHKRSR